MQAKVINVPAGTTLGQVLNPVVDTNFINYVQQQFQSAYETLKDLNNRFAEKVTSMFNYFTSNEFLNTGKELIMESGMKHDNVIHPVNTENIFDPGMLMRAYIMSNPVLWALYQKFAISGYNDMFVFPSGETDIEPEMRHEYLQVMDGVVQPEEDGYKVIFYCAEDKLTTREKITVLDAWDDAMFLIEQGIDPTSPDKNQL